MSNKLKLYKKVKPKGGKKSKLAIFAEKTGIIKKKDCGKGFVLSKGKCVRSKDKLKIRRVEESIDTSKPYTMTAMYETKKKKK